MLQPGANGATYPVTQHLFHRYTSFPQFVFGQDPAFVPSFRGDQPSEIEGYGYDIGLLRIEGQLPPDLVMTLAPKEELLALKPGAPLASAGYPYENVSGDTVIAVAATPQVHYGNVTALTDFLFLPTAPACSYLVQHSIPGTGGSSGSLIVASSGHVVAIDDAGNFGPRGESSARGAPSGVEINYAQRADLIADLIGGQAQAAYDADRPYWTTQLAKFQRGYEVIGQWVLESARPDAESTADLVSETTGLMTGDDMRVDPDTHKKQRVKVDTLNLTAGTSYFVLVYADRETPIAIYLRTPITGPGEQHQQPLVSKRVVQADGQRAFFPARHGAGRRRLVQDQALCLAARRALTRRRVSAAGPIYFERQPPEGGVQEANP